MYGVPAIEERMDAARKCVRLYDDCIKAEQKNVEKLEARIEDLVGARNEAFSRFHELRLLKDIRDNELTVVHTCDGSPVNLTIM